MAEQLTLTQRLDWLQLARSSGVGPKAFYQLLHRFGSARKAYDALPGLVRETEGRERPRCRREEAEGELDALQALGCHLVAYGEAGYPALLSAIHDPPPLLTMRGKVELLHEPSIAMVGARNASTNGCLLAGGIAKDLAAAGVAVVSGLARGIDTAVHQGALAANGPTIAVIDAGVDVAYPPENADLMGMIAETGAVISERPLGAAPQARHFPCHNRLISGLAKGVVVVEAALKSDSLITARMAIEQGRQVMAVPGSPLDARHRGANQLIRDGAALIETAEDVRRMMDGLAMMRPMPADGPMGLIDGDPDAGLFDWQEEGAAAESPVNKVNGTATSSLASREVGQTLNKRIVERLGTEPLLVDELARQCHANSAEIQYSLVELELEGRIARHAGNRVFLATS